MMGIVRRRSVGRQIVRTAATTAVVVGTAHAVSGAMNKGQEQQQQQYYEQPPAAEPQVVYVQQPAEQLAAPAEEDVMVQLQKYAKMHDAGILTDEEFAAVKAKLLGI
jgi:hypothetical protein